MHDHQVVPTPAVRARDFARQLRGCQEALATFEQDLRLSQGQPDRVNHVLVAIDHLEGAIAALARAAHQ